MKTGQEYVLVDLSPGDNETIAEMVRSARRRARLRAEPLMLPGQAIRRLLEAPEHPRD